jgi:hypothetical protein
VLPFTLANVSTLSTLPSSSMDRKLVRSLLLPAAPGPAAGGGAASCPAPACSDADALVSGGDAAGAQLRKKYASSSRIITPHLLHTCTQGHMDNMACQQLVADEPISHQSGTVELGLLSLRTSWPSGAHGCQVSKACSSYHTPPECQLPPSQFVLS